MPKKCKKCGLLNFDDEPACVACGATEFESFKPISNYIEPALTQDEPKPNLPQETNVSESDLVVQEAEEVPADSLEETAEIPVVVEPPQVKKQPPLAKQLRQDVIFEHKESNTFKLVLLNLAVGAVVLLAVFAVVRYLVVNGMLPG